MGVNSIIAAFTVAGVGFGLLLLELKAESKAHGKTQQALLQSTTVVSELNSKIVIMREDQLAIEKEALAAVTAYQSSKRQLDGMRNREATILKRKSLIALKINKAFNKGQRKLACITGDLKLCSKK